jgi:hypothetical protein
MPEAIGPFSVEERVIDGNTCWIAIRARGAEWSWLTPAEAAHLGQQWVRRYGHMLPADNDRQSTNLFIAAE